MLSNDELIQARHRLAAGRILATSKFPYYQTTMMAMVTVEVPGHKKFSVDKRWRLYYDPELCLRWSPEEIAAEWIHNVEHIIRKHEERFASLEGSAHDHQIYNAAADGAINSELRKQGIIMADPETRFYAEPNSQFPNWKPSMTAEEMYFAAHGSGGQSEDDEGGTEGSSETASDESKKDEEGNDKSTPSEAKDEDNPNEEASEEKPKNVSDHQEMEKHEGMEQFSPSPSENSENEEDTSTNDLETSESGDTPPSGETQDEETGTDSQGEPSGKPSGASEPSSGNDDPSDTNEGGEKASGEDSEGSQGEAGEPKSSGEGEGGEPSDDNSAGGESSSSREGSEGDTSDQNNSDSASGGKELPDCGSIAGGEKRDYERSDEEDDGSVDPVTAESLRKKTAEEIQNYANSHPGTVPGGLLREAKNILEPQVDWMDEFLALFRSVVAKLSGFSNYSYSRPSRRSAGSQFIMPILRNPPAPETAIVLDTSGSMDETKEIAMALAEMEEILNRVSRFSESQSIKLINCDSAAAEVAIVRDMDDFEIIGGGGTDMRVGIKAAAELQPRMDIILVITDGGTPWPRDIPKDNPYATYIVLLVGGQKARNKSIPDWMTVVEVNIPQKRFGLKMR